MANELDVKELLEKIMSSIYPVGSIYISTNSTSPATLIGGTWEPIHGRFLVAEGSNGAGGNQYLNVGAGAVGGETNHTLTVNELASHTHRISERQEWYEMDSVVRSYNRAIFNWKGGRGGQASASYRADRDDIMAKGGNAPHNNLPPYLAVYMWKRTA